MHGVHVRQATANDLDSLCTLYNAFHEFHVQGIPERLRSLAVATEQHANELTAALAALIDRNDVALFVAEVNGQCVGLAEIYLRQDEANPARVAYRYGHLQSLMVDAAHRQHGLGQQLVHAAEQWAKAHGATEIRLEVWEFSAGPLPFYERLGYHTLRRTLVRQLE
ncbi:MAG: GNAT family N-acetyltransferase [Chloroflexaceae bacterium]|nr:GNAT family N-acetyltransferase [Chloroflexaceae bacterium]